MESQTGHEPPAEGARGQATPHPAGGSAVPARYLAADLLAVVELDQQRSEFISSISHELRTPLTSISGYVELLLDGGAGSLTGPQLQILAIIDRNNRRLLTLLDDLFTLSRLESGAMSLRSDQVEVAELIAAVRQAMEPMLTDRGLTFDVVVEAGTGSLRGDPVELQRALVNLVTNAGKFTPAGVVRLTAGRTQGQVVFTVGDTGSGIGYADQERLFSRFFRARSASEQAIQGTGMGLVIVKGIVEGHGGTVSIASTPGVGTTVTVTLPAGSRAAGGSGATEVSE